MISAEIAYMNTCAQIKKISNNGLIEIEKIINENVEKGEYECYYQGKVEMDIIQELRKNGYKVRICWAEVDDYGNYHSDFIKISWRGKSKTNFFEELIRKIKEKVRK